MSFSRTLSLGGSLAGVIFNIAFALRLLALSRSLGWESESEWEGSGDVWTVDSLRIIWVLLCAYFAVASASCFIGFVGLAKRVRLFVRIYRDYSIADFVFVTLATVTACYISFNSPYLRSMVCEELARHPELMRDMGDMGLSLENCEQWFDRAVVAVLGMMFILIVVRLHIVIALSQYYSFSGPRMHLRASHTEMPMQRIYLMSTPSSPSYPTADGRSHHDDDVAVYATVPIGGITEEEARQMQVMEAWISTTPISASFPRQHRHSHSHSHSSSHRSHLAGRSSPSNRSGGGEKALVTV